MKEELVRKYIEFRNYLVNLYWYNYLSAIEKTTLQSMRKDEVEAYKLTEREEFAVLMLNNKSLESRRG